MAHKFAILVYRMIRWGHVGLIEAILRGKLSKSAKVAISHFMFAKPFTGRGTDLWSVTKSHAQPLQRSSTSYRVHRRWLNHTSTQSERTAPPQL
jgi:hypothetical protein